MIPSISNLFAWKLIGYLGITLFASRWLVQLYTSHRAKKSIITRGFWLLSLLGSMLLTLYFMFGSHDRVGVIANGVPILIALYNLSLGRYN